VVIMTSTGQDFIGAFMGAPRLGAIAARLSTELRGESLKHPLALYQPRLVVVDADLAQLVHVAMAHESPAPDCVILDNAQRKRLDAQQVPDAGELPLLGLSDPSMIMATSGTTGPSKGSLWAHGTIRHRALIYGHQLGQAHHLGAVGVGHSLSV